MEEKKLRDLFNDSSWLGWDWKISKIVLGLLLEDKMAMSSANEQKVVDGRMGISAVYRVLRKGPRMLPCGTPALKGVYVSENFSLKS